MGFNTRAAPAVCQRPEIGAILTKRLTAFTQGYRQNIALVGYPGVGKTSLVFDILRMFADRPLIPIYVDVPVRGAERFARTFVGILLFQSFSKESAPPADDLDGLLEHAKKKIPRTARACASLLKALAAGEMGEAWPQLLALPQLVYEETNRPVLLVLDEFHNLEQLGFPAPFFELSNKIMVQKNIMHLLISSAPCAAETILKEKLSLLFGNFECIHVPPFGADTARQFIQERLAPVAVPEPMGAFLAHITGGYPLYLDVLTEQLRSVALLAPADTLTKAQLVTSISDVLAKEHGIINQHFTHRFFKLFTNGESGLGLSVLLAIANGCLKMVHLAAAVHKPAAEISRLIHRLVEADVIRKRGVFSEITDPLLSLWLRLVIQRQRNSFDVTRLTSAEAFEQDLAACYERYSVEIEKDVGQRIKELFALFTNDIIELDNKRFMLSQFDTLKLSGVNGVQYLDARRNNARWRCYIERQAVTESSVANTLAAATPDRRCSRRIMIALGGIDDNARLKALESKFWIWDRSVLNELMSLYQKPHVVI